MYTYIILTKKYYITVTKTGVKMKLFNLENESYFVQSDVFLTKFGHKLPLYLLSLIMCERVGNKIIARMLCFMHQSIFRPNYIFNSDAYFLDFRAQKFPLIFFNLNPF